MTEGMPPLALNLLSDLGEAAGFVLRLTVALVGAVFAWYLSGPLAKGLYRLIVQKPMPGAAVVLTRIGAAVLVGVLLFRFITFGSGGGGTGGGQGSWVGPGSGGGTGTGTGTDKGTGQKDGKEKKLEVTPGKSNKTIHIEIVLSKHYNKKGYWYLIESQPPPKPLAEVEEYLKSHKGKYKNMDILLYANSVEPEHYAVKALEDLGEKYKLRTYIPKEYQRKEKPETPE
jgi:hypothetical protein